MNHRAGAEFEGTHCRARHRALRSGNAAASVMAIAAGCMLFSLLPVHHPQLARRYGPPGLTFSGQEFLLGAAMVYAAAVLVHMLWLGPARVSKSLRAIRWLWCALRSIPQPRSVRLTRKDRVALLATLLKMFFGPMMVMSLMVFVMAALANGRAMWLGGVDLLSSRLIFDRFGYWFLMQAVLLVDVLIFTVGYLVESRRLGNEIRSVDSTWLGWAVTLACYPPFNAITHRLLGSQVSDFPRFEDATVHVVLNLLLLSLMGAYAAASVAMGFKASNLTHRGIVSRGPYAVIRHPAYICKNMAWWIASVPLVGAAFGRSFIDGLFAVGSVMAWTLVYVMRAFTEEQHLRRVDGAYAEYADRVRYRFVPGVF